MVAPEEPVMNTNSIKRQSGSKSPDTRSSPSVSLRGKVPLAPSPPLLSLSPIVGCFELKKKGEKQTPSTHPLGTSGCSSEAGLEEGREEA